MNRPSARERQLRARIKELEQALADALFMADAYVISQRLAGNPDEATEGHLRHLRMLTKTRPTLNPFWVPGIKL